ncbi:MAG TPA: Calx-beta domain-containing protein [Nocardioides sp.]|uniref:Calx-beta domain-containing protein n=1 Tax=Nocardioides sp. TaxID=35761 RepID=UPI002ED909EF
MSKQITRAAAVAAITALAAGLTTAPAVAAPKKPKVSVADIVVSEGDGTATLTLTVNKKSKKKVKLNWSTQARPKSAKAGEDFTAVKKGRVVLAPGETTATLTVPILDDTVAEGEEFFFVKFNGKAVKVKRPMVKVTIADDDATPTPPPAA